MQGKARTYFIIGVLFVVIGIIMTVFTKTSRTMAYGDTVFGIAMLALSVHEKKKNNDDHDDGDKED